MRASQPDPQGSTVEFDEAGRWYEMQQTCQRVAATDRKHESRVRSEDRDREGEGKKVRRFRGNHTEDNGNLPGPPTAGVAD